MSVMGHAELRTERRKARIRGKDVADELGIDSGALSRFELYGAPLPHGLTEADYHAALVGLAATRPSRRSSFGKLGIANGGTGLPGGFTERAS